MAMIGENLLKICGTCGYAYPNFPPKEIEALKRRVWYHQRRTIGLNLLKRKVFKNVIKKEVFCQREKIRVKPLESACALWIPIDGSMIKEKSKMLTDEFPLEKVGINKFKISNQPLPNIFRALNYEELNYEKE